MLYAEIRRQFTSATFVPLVVFSVALNAVSMFGTASGRLHAPGNVLDPTELTHALVALGFGASLVSLIYGAIFAARDIDTRFIIRQSYLAGGVWHLFAHKACICVVAGLVFGVLANVTSHGVSTILLAPRGASVDVRGDTPAILAGVVCSVAGYSLIGFAVGWLIRNTIAATITVVIYTLVVESLVIAWNPDLGRLLPSRAFDWDSSSFPHPRPGGRDCRAL